MLQITSTQQHAPIHFILPHLKLNQTGGSTHWRRKYKTRSIRSTKSDRLTTTIRCGHNKQSEAVRSTFARLSRFNRSRIIIRVLPLCYWKMTALNASPGRDERTVIFCDPDPVLIFKNSVHVQPQWKIFFKCKVQGQMKSNILEK